MDYVNRSYSVELTYISIVFCVLIAFVSNFLIKVFKIKWCRRIVSIILCIVVFLELRLNSQYLIKSYRVSDVEHYTEYVKHEKELIDLLKDYDKGFYRINQTSNRGSGKNRITATYNEALAYHYYSITGYTSVPETIQLEFLKRCGYQMMGGTMNIVNTSVLPTDSLLGVKYILSDFSINGLKHIDTIPKQNGKDIYENPYCLPIAFTYLPNKDREEREYTNPFLYLNDLYSELSGKEIELFKPIPYQKEREDKSVTYILQEPNVKNSIVYGNILSYRYLNGNIYIDNTLQTAYSRWLTPSVFYIPNSGNDKIEVRLDTEESTSNISSEQFYYLDLEIFKECVDKLSLKKADGIEIKNGYISGSVIGKEGEYLFLSVPYHKQWKVVCNHIEVEPELFGDCLMTIPLLEGENVITIRYKVQGFTEGILISILSLCIFIIVIFANKLKKDKRRV